MIISIPIKKASLRIIYYHLIATKNPTYYNQQASIDPKLFKKQLKYFKKHFNIISIDTAAQMAADNVPFNGHLVLTFDDGFKELFQYVFPILDEEKVTACTYLISNCIDNKDLMWRNKLEFINNTCNRNKINEYSNEIAHLFNIEAKKGNESLLEWSSTKWEMNNKDCISNLLWETLSPIPLEEFLAYYKAYLNTTQINECRNLGHAFGNHTKSHPICNKLSFEEFEYEVNVCKTEIKTKLNLDVKHFSYPFGIRTSIENERKFLDYNPDSVLSMVGTKNRLMNYSNYYRWERDRLEVRGVKQTIRFTILPIIRNLGILN